MPADYIRRHWGGSNTLISGRTKHRTLEESGKLQKYFRSAQINETYLEGGKISTPPRSGKGPSLSMDVLNHSKFLDSMNAFDVKHYVERSPITNHPRP